jgi:glutathione synthase/RimK-type ligase-like ATP-grasp enzyme
MTYKIGLIAGMETTFPDAFIAKVNQHPGFHAELARIGHTPEVFTSPYQVLIDRLSHEVPYYRFHLKAAALAGTYVINDPFWWSADEKFFGYSLAAKIGVKVPRTVMLPSHSYIPSIDPLRSLRNLEYPLAWKELTDYVGFPAILKPADGGGWKNVSRVNDLQELWRDYNGTGTLVMTLQEFIDFDDYIRCICIGKEFILPIKYDPKRRDHRGWRGAYIETDNPFSSKDLEHQVMDGCWKLNNALGYDMNSVEWAIKDGVAYAIDFTNPAPDMDLNSILPRYFHIVVDEMAKFAMKVAKEGRPNHDGYPFREFIASPRPRPTARRNEVVAPPPKKSSKAEAGK